MAVKTKIIVVELVPLETGGIEVRWNEERGGSPASLSSKTVACRFRDMFI